MFVKKNKTKDIIILGHRGYRKCYPENTGISFQKAFEYGAQGVEFDVQKTSDGQFIIFHDYETERLTGLKGNVKSFSRRELAAFKIDGKENIPDLGEYLRDAPLGKFYNMELKEETIVPGDCEAIYELVKNLKIKDCMMVSSFRHDLLGCFKNKNFTIGLLPNRRDVNYMFFNLIKTLYRLRPEYLNLPITFFVRIPSFFKYLILKSFRLMGFKIAFWTVNTEEDFLKVYKYSDLIMTDEVEKIVKLKDSLK